MQADFHYKSHAKWILAGEHAVLRGHPALVFPIPGKYIELFYWHSSHPLQVDFNTPYGETFLVLFWGLFEEGLKLLQKKHHEAPGRLFFRNNIPMGAGMGFSAAFCVSMARWFHWKGWLCEQECFEFARQLENYFHGKSSGVDIAGALHDTGVYYRLDAEMRPIHVSWRPHLYLSHCGQVSVTSKCVHLVNELWEQNRAVAEEIDITMTKSVMLAENALFEKEEKGLLLLQQAINTACQCFTAWGLVSEELDVHMAHLNQAGALACKPTGAGDGGHILSLWDKVPELPFEMIAVF